MHPGTLVDFQRGASVSAGFKLPIMQRSLIREASPVSLPSVNTSIAASASAWLTWSDGTDTAATDLTASFTPVGNSRLNDVTAITACAGRHYGQALETHL